MKSFWSRSHTPDTTIPAPQQADAHQARVLDALWPESATRRRFLIGVGGSLPMVGSLARAATDFVAIEDPYGVSLRISDMTIWRVDTRWFDGTPRVKVRQRPDTLQIELRTAGFPGTGLAADFVLRAIRRNGQWQARFRFDALNFSSEVNLANWLLGSEAAAGTLRIAAARLAGTDALGLREVAGKATFRPDWSFFLERARTGTMELDGHAIGVRDLRLELEAPLAIGPRHDAATRAWVSVDSGASFAFDLHGGALELGAGPALAFVQSRRHMATVLLEPRPGGDVRPAAHMCWRGDADVRLPVDGACGRFELTGAGVARSAGARWQRAYWHVDPHFTASFSTVGLAEAFGARGPASAAARAASASPALSPVATHFVVDLPGVDAAIFELRAIAGLPAAGQQFAEARHFAHNGIPLRHYDLKLRRASDAMFCTVRFSGLALQRRDDAWRLVQMNPNEAALLEFDFGSQHTMEEATPLEAWPALDPNTYRWPDPRPPAAGATRGQTPASQAPLPAAAVRFEAARPSHLTFAMKRPGKLAHLPLTVDALFSWSSDGGARAAPARDGWLEPVLSRRALPPGAASLLDPASGAPIADDLVIRRPDSLAGSLPDAVFGTAIEAPARLVVTPLPPDTAARGHAMVPWRSPPAGPLAAKAGRAELWYAMLRDKKFRAIYTPDAGGTGPADRSWIKVDVFGAPAPGTADRFRSDLDSYDRHNLVSLSGLFKYKILCPVTPRESCTAPDGVTPLEGEFLPLPIHADLMMLTSQGATFKYRGRWDPPAAPGSAEGALSVKRYIHWSQIGRTIFAKVEYKGFLFPLGHPAILLKQSERQFYLKNGKQFVAGLLQRYFIEVPAFNRQFPAPEQGMDGRLWGHANISMDEVVTPNLAAPADTAYFTTQPAAVVGQMAFWPSLPAGGGRVLFEFYEPATGARYRAPLAWLDNRVTHTTAELAKVINTWRAEVAKLLHLELKKWPSGPADYFATVLSARLPYVPGRRGDNTDIETSTVLLGVQVKGDVRTYDDGPVDPARLKTSGIMEGQNLPPFFPTRRRARIVSSQLATLTGQPSQAYLLQFDAVYAEQGMSPANGSSVFAQFVEVGAPMNFGDDTAKSGGFAAPSALMVSFTEKRGPVGGPRGAVVPLGVQSLPPPPAAGLTRASPPAAAEEPLTSDDFRPGDYFAAMLGDAKLLGVVRLVDILETLLAASGTSFPTIRREALFELPLQALRDIMPSIEAGLDQFDAWISKPEQQQPPLPTAVAARLQPAWNRLRAAVAAGARLIRQSTVGAPELIACASAITGAAEALLADVRAATADPVLLLPQPARELIEQARDLIDMLRGVLPPSGLVRVFQPLLEALVKQQVLQLADELIAAIANAPAYAAALQALQQLRVLVVELTLACADARLLLEQLGSHLVQRLQAAIGNALLQLAMAGAEQLSLLDELAPLLKAEVALQSGRYEVILRDIGKGQPVAQAVLGLHAMLDRCAKQVRPADQRASVQAAQQLSNARQAVSAISDALNAHVDRMQRIHDEGPRIVQWLQSGAARASTSDGELVPLVVDVIEQMFDAVNLGLLAVDRLADIVAGLGKLPGLTAEQQQKARTELAAAATQLGKLVPAGLFDHIGGTLRQLSERPPLPMLGDLRPLCGRAATAVHAVQVMLFDAAGLLGKDPAFWRATHDDVRAALSTAYAGPLRMLHEIDKLRGTLVSAIAVLSPRQLEARVRAEVQRRLARLTAALRGIAGQTLAQVATDAAGLFCQGGGVRLLELLARLRDSNSPYLSEQARTALTRATNALQACRAGANADIGEIVASLLSLTALLGRSLATGDASQLVDMQKMLDNVIAGFGIPTRVRVNYDWDTKVESFPKGNDAVFEPRGDRRLSIQAVMDAGVRGAAVTASVQARLAPFAVHLFGKTGMANFLDIEFDGLTLNASPGKGLTCQTKVTRVRPGAALGFVDKLSTLFAPNAGFYMLPTPHGIEVGYRFASEYELLAGLVLQNIAFAISASLPFDNAPMRVQLRLSDKEKPFLISAGIYGGGGFLAITTRADTLEQLEASFEYGAMVAFQYGPARGSGRVTAGIYIRLGGRDPVIEGFFCAQGEVNIANLINMSACLRVNLTYHLSDGKASGNAIYKFKFSIGFFDFSYSARVDYAQQGDRGGAAVAGASTLALAGGAASTMASAKPGPAQRRRLGARPASGPAPDQSIRPGLLAPPAWRRYWRAFARPDPDRAPRIESVSRAPQGRYLRGTDRATDTAVKKIRLAVAAAAAPAVTEAHGHIEWYCVPWGLDGGGALRLSVRAMPKPHGTPAAGVSLAYDDWPAFMAAIGNVTLDIDGHAREVDLGGLYLSRLKELGLTLATMSALWRELFPVSLRTKPANAVQTMGAPRAERLRSRLQLHDSADLAKATASRVGELFAAGLADFEPKLLKAAVAQGYVAAAAVGPGAATALDTMATLYAPVVTRQRRGSAPARAPAPGGAARGTPDQQTVVRLWHANLLRGTTGPGAAAAGGAKADGGVAPYSVAALNYLDHLLTRSELPIRAAKTGADNPADFADRFTRRVLQQQVAYASDQADATTLPEESFADRLAGLTTHPWLLKALGLTVDLQLALPPGVAAGQFKVMLTRWQLSAQTPAIVPHYPMRTNARDGYPATAPDDLKYANSRLGCLDLGAPHLGRHLLTQVDIDRTPQRLLQLSLAYRNEIMAGRRPDQASSAMQAQETVGLSLIAHDPQLNAPSGDRPERGRINEIHLHHLALGYRPDVQRLVSGTDPAGARDTPWASLMARRLRRVRLGGRDITALLRGIEVDEGILMERTRSVSAAVDGKTHSAELVEGELFRWGNWGLGAPHPDSEGAPLHTGLGGDQPAAIASPALRIDYEAAPGAPVQRYGSGYRVGMRLVMLDGNSSPLDEAARRAYAPRDPDAGAGASDDARRSLSLGDGGDPAEHGYTPFLRYEPIAPPQPLMLARPQRDRFPTESARKLVVSSGVAGAERTLTQRVLVPPRCASIDLAIRHGLFDAAQPQRTPPASAFPGVELTARGDFPSFDHGSGQHATRESYYAARAGARAPEIPYYPDPWAQRLIIGFYRAADDCLLAFDYFDYYDASHRWPNCRALRLDLRAAERVDNPALGFDWSLEQDRLTVRVAPGVRLTLRCWHEMDMDKLNQSAVVDQLVVACRDPEKGTNLCANLDTPGDADDAQLRAAIIKRLSQWDARRDFHDQTARPANRLSVIANLTSFWMLNPSVALELLHAAAKPLRAPALSDVASDSAVPPALRQIPAHASGLERPFRIVRAAAQTSASFAGHLRLHRPSTGAVAAQAKWTDNPMRGVLNPKSGRYAIAGEERRGLLFNLTGLAEVAVDDRGAPADQPLAPELGPDQYLQLLEATVPVSAARPLDRRPVSGSYDFGDTRARVLEVQLLARARHALDLGGADKPEQLVTSAAQRVIAPATERPDAPTIEYVIPLYNWSDGEDFGRVHRTREAGWFRIWLGNAWYSAGNGELLAIVCWPNSLLAPLPRPFLLSRIRPTPFQYATPPAAIEPMVTRWGLDPLLQQRADMGNMPASALKNRLRTLAQMEDCAADGDATIGNDIQHLQDMPSFEPALAIDPALPAEQVTLALYRPLFDKASGRWFADIQIDPQYAYCPFVRLALARYQPHALPGLQMSAIVATEFIQLMPRRTTTIVPLPKVARGTREFAVNLAGPSLSAASVSGQSRSELSVRVERRPAGRKGWRPLPPATPAAALDPWQGTRMEYVKRDDVWSATVALQPVAGDAYSLVIEEYEHLSNGVDESRKLVFFDRITLPANA